MDQSMSNKKLISSYSEQNESELFVKQGCHMQFIDFVTSCVFQTRDDRIYSRLSQCFFGTIFLQKNWERLNWNLIRILSKKNSFLPFRQHLLNIARHRKDFFTDDQLVTKPSSFGIAFNLPQNSSKIIDWTEAVPQSSLVEDPLSLDDEALRDEPHRALGDEVGIVEEHEGGQ